MKRAGLLLVVVIVITTALFAGPANEQRRSRTRNENVRVLLHARTQEEDAYYDEIIAEFNRRSRGVRVVRAEHSGGDHTEEVWRATMREDIPHIFQIDSAELGAMAHSGLIVPIGTELSVDTKVNILDSFLYKYEGEVYMVAQSQGGLSLWANRRLLDQAGVRLPTIDGPWSAAEFTSALESIRELGEVKEPLALRIGNGPVFSIRSIESIVHSFGGSWWNRETKRARGTMDSPQTVHAIRYLQWLIEEGYATADGTDSFLEGESALILAGRRYYEEALGALGNDLIPLPLPDIGHGVWTSAGGLAWALSATATDDGVQESAIRFIEFLLEDETIRALVSITREIPCHRSVLETDPLFEPAGALRLYRDLMTSGNLDHKGDSPIYSLMTEQINWAMTTVLNGEDVLAALSGAAATTDSAAIRVF